MDISRCRRFLAILALLLSAAIPRPGSAAEVFPSDDPDCHLELRGEIVEGDAARLEQAMNKYQRPDFPTDCSGQTASRALCLDSPGGSFSEGREMAHLVQNWAYGTRIGAGAECVSACAFVFMAGYESSERCESQTADRVLNAGGRLGLHTPYFLLDPEDVYTGAAVNKFLPDYNSLLAGFLDISAFRPAFDRSSLISMKLWIEFLATPPRELYLINTVGKAARWGVSVDGIREARLLGVADRQQACVNLLNWIHDDKSYPLSEWGDTNYGLSHFDGAEYGIGGKNTRYERWEFDPMYGGSCVFEDQSTPSGEVIYCIEDGATGLALGNCSGALGFQIRLSVPWWHAMPPDMPLVQLR